MIADDFEPAGEKAQGGFRPQAATVVQSIADAGSKFPDCLAKRIDRRISANFKGCTLWDMVVPPVLAGSGPLPDRTAVKGDLTVIELSEQQQL